MRFRIHFETPDGGEDSIVVEGDTVEAVREASEQEMAQRGGKNPWSEEVSDGR